MICLLLMEVLYIVLDARCCMREIRISIMNNQQKNKTRPIDHFVLTIEHGEGLIVCIDESKVSRDGTRSYSMSVRGLCYNICDAAERYYKKNKDRFSLNYELVDLDDRMRDLRGFAKLFPPITSANIPTQESINLRAFFVLQGVRLCCMQARRSQLRGRNLRNIYQTTQRSRNFPLF